MVSEDQEKGPLPGGDLIEVEDGVPAPEAAGKGRVSWTTL